MYLLSIPSLDIAETFESFELAKARFFALEGSVFTSHWYTVEHPDKLDSNGNRIYIEACDISDREILEGDESNCRIYSNY